MLSLRAGVTLSCILAWLITAAAIIKPKQPQENSGQHDMRDTSPIFVFAQTTPFLFPAFSFGSIANDSARAIAVDSSSERLYVIGSTDGNFGPGNAGSSDIYITAYSSDGERLWIQQLGSSTRDAAADVIVDTDGAVYFVGTTEGFLNGEVNAGGADVFLTKYDRDGSMLWLKLLGSNGTDTAVSVSISNNNSVLVTGTTNGNLGGPALAPNTDGFIAEFTHVGALLSVRRSGLILSSSDSTEFHGSALDPYGFVYLTGRTHFPAGVFITKQSSTGSIEWTARPTAASTATGQDVTVSPDGNDVYFVGYAVVNGRYTIVLGRYATASGFQRWLKTGLSFTEGVASVGYSISSDLQSTAVFVAGEAGGRGFLARISSSGTEDWAMPLGDGSGRSVATSPSGAAVYAVGDSLVGSSHDVFVFAADTCGPRQRYFASECRSCPDCEPDGSCTSDNEGLLCNLCPEGSYRQGRQCATCTSIYVIVALIILLVLAIILLKASGYYVGRKHATPLRIVFHFIQLTSFLLLLSVQWPEYFRDGFLSVFFNITFAFTHASCFHGSWSHLHSVLASFAVPAFVIGAIQMHIRFLRYQAGPSQATQRSYERQKHRLHQIQIMICVFSYAVVVDSAMASFVCQNGVLTAEPSILCPSTQYDRLVVVAGILAGVVGLVPVCIGIYLATVFAQKSKEEQLEDPLYILTEMYNGYPYFECVIMLRKLAEISLYRLLTLEPRTQALSTFSVSLVYLLIVLQTRPFVNIGVKLMQRLKFDLANDLEVAASAMLCLSRALGILAAEQGSATDTVAGVIFALNVLFVAAIMSRFAMFGAAWLMRSSTPLETPENHLDQLAIHFRTKPPALVKRLLDPREQATLLLVLSIESFIACFPTSDHVYRRFGHYLRLRHELTLAMESASDVGLLHTLIKDILHHRHVILSELRTLATDTSSHRGSKAPIVLECWQTLISEDGVDTLPPPQWLVDLHEADQIGEAFVAALSRLDTDFDIASEPEAYLAQLQPPTRELTAAVHRLRQSFLSAKAEVASEMDKLVNLQTSSSRSLDPRDSIILPSNSTQRSLVESTAKSQTQVLATLEGQWTRAGSSHLPPDPDYDVIRAFYNHLLRRRSAFLTFTSGEAVLIDTRKAVREVQRLLSERGTLVKETHWNLFLAATQQRWGLCLAFLTATSDVMAWQPHKQWKYHVVLFQEAVKAEASKLELRLCAPSQQFTVTCGDCFDRVRKQRTKLIDYLFGKIRKNALSEPSRLRSQSKRSSSAFSLSGSGTSRTHVSPLLDRAEAKQAPPTIDVSSVAPQTARLLMQLEQHSLIDSDTAADVVSARQELIHHFRRERWHVCEAVCDAINRIHSILDSVAFDYGQLPLTWGSQVQLGQVQLARLHD